MTSPAQQSDAILAAARASLADQRAGGRRVATTPIGQYSAALRRARTRTIAMATLMAGGMFAAMGVVLGLVAGAVHGAALVAGGVAVMAAFVTCRSMLRRAGPIAPSLDQLRQVPPRRLVGNAQLWLEGQRAALPPPAQPLVRQIGARLDLLGLQIERLDENAPVLGDVRRLVGEHLPQMVGAYTEIPATLRRENHAGTSPDAQLLSALGQIDGEIDRVTRQLAEGALDRLAIETRFLDAKYGEAVAGR